MTGGGNRSRHHKRQTRIKHLQGSESTTREAAAAKPVSENARQGPPEERNPTGLNTTHPRKDRVPLNCCITNPYTHNTHPLFKA